MPYRLSKVDGGYKVAGPSGVHYSKKPQSKERALSQMRAIHASEFSKGSKRSE